MIRTAVCEAAGFASFLAAFAAVSVALGVL